MKNQRPNFVELVSEKFNGGSGDTASLYEVVKFVTEVHDGTLNDLQQLINTMKEKDFYEEIILEEIEKWIIKRSSNP